MDATAKTTEDGTAEAAPGRHPLRLGIVSFCLLSFLFGAAVAYYKFFPYEFVRNAFIGTRALYERFVVTPMQQGSFDPSLWAPARNGHAGLTRVDPERAYPGYTLLMSSHAQEAALLDLEGRVVHRWAKRFAEVWPEPPHVANPVAEDRIYWRAARVYPNGDLLVVFVGHGDTPYGYGLAKLDRDSRVLWRYAERVHHDLDIGPDGRIYALLSAIDGDGLAGLPQLRPPFLHDYLAVLSPAGEELQRISLLEAMQGSPYRAMLEDVLALQARGDALGDYTHANSVSVIRRGRPGTALMPGRVLVSLREIDAVGAIDPASGRFTWATRGPWKAQHDVEMLDNGRLLLFDNLGHLGPGGRSRILEFDPETLEIAWSFAGDAEEYFFSYLRARQQRLPNGNTLITESSSGRLFEVTPEGQVVWEYWNPARGGGAGELVAIVTGGLRLGADEVTFLND